jgi:hypothetical protein
VLVPGTRRAHELVASLYQSHNVAEVTLGTDVHEFHITRLLSRLPAAPRTEVASSPLGAPSAPLAPVGEEGEEEMEEGGEPPRAAEGGGEQLVPAVGSGEHLVVAVGSGEQLGAAVGSGDLLGAAVGSGEQLGAAVGSGERLEAAVRSGEQLGAAVGSGARLEAAVGSGEQLGADAIDTERSSDNERMSASSAAPTDEDIPDADVIVAVASKTRGSKQRAGRRVADPNPAKLLKADGQALKAARAKAKEPAAFHGLTEDGVGPSSSTP